MAEPLHILVLGSTPHAPEWRTAGHEVTELMAPQAPVTVAGGGLPVAPLGTQAYNPAFDVTPPELVTAIVTEDGVVSPVTAAGLAELCARSRASTAGQRP